MPLQYTVQFPRIVPMQFCFHPYIHPLVYKKERMIFLFRQVIWDDDVFHIAISNTQIYDNSLIQ